MVVSVAEHHANLVPWQIVCKATGATLKHVHLSESEELDMADLADKVTSRTKLVALVHVSNTLGCVLPVERVVKAARHVGAKLLLDCCQSVPHMPVDVQVPPAVNPLTCGCCPCFITPAQFVNHARIRCTH